jgi:ADP-heptose:LPS heptosyltransferase
MASLLTRDARLPETLCRSLDGVSLAIAYTRSADLAGNLRTLIETVIVHEPQPPPEGGHASVWLASALVPLGIDVSADPPPCVPTSNEEELAAPWIERLPSRFLAIHPGSGSPSKNWPAQSFAALVGELQPDGAWLLVEGPADDDSASSLRRRPGVVVAAGLSPRTLGAILRRAGVYVGNDSGVSHLAAAWGAPTVALFGPTEPRVWAPVGPRVRVVRAASTNDIPVEAVVAATRGMSTLPTPEPL